MDAKHPRKLRSLRPSEPPLHDKPRRSVHDKLFEHSFYISAVALIALMEWYTHLMNTPRMVWVYLALVMIAIGYAVLRLPSFKARLGLSKQARGAGQIAARSEEPVMKSPINSVSTASETVSAADTKEADAAAVR